MVTDKPAFTFEQFSAAVNEVEDDPVIWMKQNLLWNDAIRLMTFTIKKLGVLDGGVFFAGLQVGFELGKRSASEHNGS